MATVYFPGCKFSALSPRSSERMQAYLRGRGVEVAGCCRLTAGALGKGDLALVVCPTCLSVLSEGERQASCRTLWEYLIAEDAFPWPYYQGEEIWVQDCLDSNGNMALRTAVRGVLGKMGFRARELPGFPGGDSRFCNLSPTHTAEAIEGHCRGLRGAKVACYCTGCHRALRPGGVDGVHLLDLLTADM